MPPDSLDALAYRVGRLDEAALRAFVADLWRRRGYAVEEAGADLLAESARRTVRIRVRGSPDGPPTPDVVVDADREVTGPAVRDVGAEDLAEMVVYALETGSARDLCVAHLGAPPADVRPSPSARLRGRIESTVSRVEAVRRRVGTARPAHRTALALSVLVVLALAVVLIGPGSTAPSPSVDADSTPLGTGDTNFTVPRPTYPTPPVGGYLDGAIETPESTGSTSASPSNRTRPNH